jgi:leader peptidase (prepilin peptidase)/N-methyltransferase
MGEGDVKFVGFIGAFCGWQGAVFSMFGGALVGTVVLLPALLIGRFFSGNKATKDKTHVENLPSVEDSEEEEVQFGALVPFGPMLAVAALIYFLGFHLYVDAYFANFVLHFLTP